MSEITQNIINNDRDFVSSTVIAKRNLNSIAHDVARIYRKARLNAEEARYVHKRVRQLLGLRGRPSGSNRLPEVLSSEELQCILARAYCEHPRYGLIVRTLFETGMRVSELAGIQASAIDFTERTIRVNGKGDKDRLVLFTEDLGQQLRLHLNNHARGFLFESNRLTPFTPRRIQQIVKVVARKAGILKRIHPHTYRHSMATFLRNQGVPLDVVQLLLGHNDPRTTQIYARLSLESAREEYDCAMNKMIPHKRTSL
jgi:site-specific recombinase XerD